MNPNKKNRNIQSLPEGKQKRASPSKPTPTPKKGIEKIGREAAPEPPPGKRPPPPPPPPKKKK
jgi:hypothetical protein